MPPQVCPTDGELSEFTLGQLPADRLETIGDHLDACPACATRLLRLGSRPDPLADAVRQAGRVAAFAPDATPPAALRDYRIEGVLGEGGMGTVYRAVHTRLGRPVALKLLTARRRLDPDAGTRFEREMRAIGALRHPHIVQPTDAGEIDGVPFLAMELLDGRDLARLVIDRGPLGVADACEAVRQAALGLQHAHGHGMVHRDVKPSNLMLAADGTVKVLDLGLARTAERDEAADPAAGTVVRLGDLTETDTRVGTAAYMAPEQGTAPAGVDARADVYALGRTLAFLLTGSPSVPAAGAAPGGLRKLIRRLQDSDPADRYPTAAAAAAALRPWARGHDLPALLGRPRTRRRHFPRALVVGLALAAGGVTAVAALRPPRDPGPAGAVTDSAPAAGAPRPEPEPAYLGHTAEQAQAAQRRWALYLDRPVGLDGPAGIRLELVPPGELVVRYARQARITRPYWLGRTEVTRSQFRAFVQATGYRTDAETGVSRNGGTYQWHTFETKPPDPEAKRVEPRPARKTVVPHSRSGRDVTWREPGYPDPTDDDPVTQVSWNDAAAFCEWLTRTDGARYRLPTEAEAEWAARAGQALPYPTGNTPDENGARLEEFAWTSESSPDRPRPVGRLRPNAWGLFDTSGNVAEWCRDCWENGFPSGLLVDYAGPPTGDRRVVFGSSYLYRLAYVRRQSVLPILGYSDIGFRVLREP
jgi:serine/threonine protein kinase